MNKSFTRPAHKPYVNISDKAKAVTALVSEFELLEQEQLKVGEQMAVLVARQVVLSEKCRIIKKTLGDLCNDIK